MKTITIDNHVLIDGMVQIFYGFLDDDGQWSFNVSECCPSLLQNTAWPKLRYAVIRSCLLWM